MSSDAAVPPIVGATGGAQVAETELKAGAIGFWGNMVQAVTHIAPGLNVLLGLTFIVSFAGVTAPIAYLLGGIICLGVAIVWAQLAKQFTGGGGDVRYISRDRPALGWITTWLTFCDRRIASSSWRLRAAPARHVEGPVRLKHPWYISSSSSSSASWRSRSSGSPSR
jgi:hypothetical protein